MLDVEIVVSMLFQILERGYVMLVFLISVIIYESIDFPNYHMQLGEFLIGSGSVTRSYTTVTFTIFSLK